MNIVRLHRLIASLMAVFLYFGISGERASASPPRYEWHEIHNAARAGDLKKVKEILDSKPTEIEAKLGVYHWKGNREADVTPLSVAAAEGKAGVVELLLERGARINCGLGEGPSAYPLHEAARHGHLDIARLLLDHGAEVNAVGTADGTTALHLACQGGHAEMAEFLLGKGARVNAIKNCWLDSEGWCEGVTALHLATAAGNTKVVNLLMEHGADVNAQEKNENTALHLAAHAGNLLMTKLLIGWGADPRMKNKEGQTPADTAQAAGNQFPSRRKEYAETASLLGSAIARPLNKEEKAALLEQVKVSTNSESGNSKLDKMLGECKTTTSGETFYRQAAMLIQAKDARVIEVIGDRTNDFQEFDQMFWFGFSPEFYKTLYQFNIPETRALAKRWLVVPPAEAPYLKAFLAKQNATVPFGQLGIGRDESQVLLERDRRFWAGLILLKGNSEEQTFAVKGLTSLFGDFGLGPTRNATTNSVESLNFNDDRSLPFKIQELLHSKCNAARPLALVFLGPLSGPYAGINLEVIRVMFNGGSPEALGVLTTALRSNPYEESTGSVRVVGADVVLNLLGSQNSVPDRYIYPDWAPPGFAYSDKEPQPSKKLKREQVACWLEKKFQEIKSGKSDPLSTWDSFKGSGIQ